MPPNFDEETEVPARNGKSSRGQTPVSTVLSKVKDGRVSKSSTPAPRSTKSPTKSVQALGSAILAQFPSVFGGDKAKSQADDNDEDNEDADDSIEHDGLIPEVLSTMDGPADKTEETEAPSAPATKARRGPKKGTATAVKARSTRTRVTKTAASAKTQTKATENTKATKTASAGKAADVDPDAEYEVEKVVNSRVNNRRKKQVQYEVKWIGYDDTSWENASNLENAQEAVQKFHKENPRHPKPK